jgi:1,2-phenylacetyl-CoA epoxidase catalytic subunit
VTDSRSRDAAGAAYLLGLADDALVYGQRLGEWLTNAPGGDAARCVAF